MEREDLQLPSVDTLVETIFYLTTRFAFSQDSALIYAINLHFAMLERHVEASSSLSNTSRRLRAQWLSLLDKLESHNDQCAHKLGSKIGLSDIH